MAELASGSAQTRIHEMVDPARCKIWEYHNRDYAALSPENCVDLIDSIKAQGRQEMPAIVRRVSGDPNHAWEVICGARRHWTITWLRAHDYPDLKFLIEPRELTDEEAFRVADLENRSRKDLSDYERARDYARAIDVFYDGSQQRMAGRLEVTKSWLSRYLELARLPTEVLEAFGTSHAIGISHAAALAPLLKNPAHAHSILEEAAVLAVEQKRYLAEKGVYLAPAICVQRLLRSKKEKIFRKGSTRAISIRGKDGALLLKAKWAQRGGGLTIDIPKVAKAPRPELIKAFEELLDGVEDLSVERERR